MQAGARCNRRHPVPYRRIWVRGRDEIDRQLSGDYSHAAAEALNLSVKAGFSAQQVVEVN